MTENSLRTHDRERVPPTDMLTCAQCDALNPCDGLLCLECGAVLGQALILPASEQAAALREEASAALRRAYAWIAGVTWLYRLGALAYCCVAVVAVLALSQIEVPVGAGVLVVGLTTALAVLLLQGALHILFKPFVWAVVVALAATGVAVAHFLGPNPLGLALPASAVLAALLWASLLPTQRFSKLIARHKDLYILHHASLPTRRSLTGRTLEERHERLLAAMRDAGRRAWKLSAALGLALSLAAIVGTHAVLTNARPERFEDARARFEAAWNDGGIAGATAQLDERVRAGRLAWLAGVADGHGFDGGLLVPQVGSGIRQEGEGGHVRIDYDLAGVPLSASWVLDDLRWTLVALELPAPPLEPTLGRFLAAWRSSDVETLCAHFSPENRAAMVASISSAAGQRGWSALPEIRDTTSKNAGAEEAVVTLALDKGKVTARWYLRNDGTWGLSHLRFPPL